MFLKITNYKTRDIKFFTAAISILNFNQNQNSWKVIIKTHNARNLMLMCDQRAFYGIRRNKIGVPNAKLAKLQIDQIKDALNPAMARVREGHGTHSPASLLSSPQQSANTVWKLHLENIPRLSAAVIHTHTFPSSGGGCERTRIQKLFRQITIV